MAQSINRREFMTASAGIAAGLGLGAVSSDAQTPAAGRGGGSVPVSPLTFRTKPHKALIARPTEDDLRRMKDAGFEGVEGRVIPPDEAAKMRAVADKIGMRIHSVLYGWAEFNSPDKSEVERTFAESQAALRTAEAFGADTVLLVPCRIGSRGGRAGDNAPYADYIKAHNHATDTSVEWVKRLIPLAEKTKVVIALENVSNNLWVTPEIFRHFVQSFQSPWVKAYYDIGNHVRFSPPEKWILTLNDLIAKIHVKNYLLNPADPDGRGTSVNIREGSVRWPVLRQALEAVNYNGWMTIESNGDIPFEERNRRLDLILAGQ